MSNPFEPTSTGAPPLDDDLILADLGSRFLASLVDSVVGWVPLVPAVAVVAVLGEEAGDDPPPIFIALALLGFIGLLGVAGYQWMLISTLGQTIGKRMLGIRIVCLDGSPVDFVRGVILRNWIVGFALGIANQCCLGWVVFLVDVLPIFGEERRCLHDHIAGTKVVVGMSEAR